MADVALPASSAETIATMTADVATTWAADAIG